MNLFKKPKSKFYWYDFTVRGRRYRASSQETKSVRSLQIAGLKLASVMERTNPLPNCFLLAVSRKPRINASC